MPTTLPYQAIEQFERRIEEIETEIEPQLREMRALKAGLDRLRREAERRASSN